MQKGGDDKAAACAMSLVRHGGLSVSGWEPGGRSTRVSQRRGPQVPAGATEVEEKPVSVLPRASRSIPGAPRASPESVSVCEGATVRLRRLHKHEKGERIKCLRKCLRTIQEDERHSGILVFTECIRGGNRCVCLSRVLTAQTEATSALCFAGCEACSRLCPFRRVQ